MVYGAILAAGKGLRMGNELPKQFMMLGGKLLVMHSLETFHKCKELSRIFVAVPGAWIGYVRELLDGAGMDDRVRAVAGGEDRSESLMRVISEINRVHGISGEDIIVTHDAARPFVTERMIIENIRAVAEYGACGTAIRATDTVSRSADGAFMEDIPARETMYQNQTPQSFNI
ncbi:MAG TPA: D-ribitol-5-phosphate cytidylyltransferase, partial [Clostridia bacterium]|nr:D-ribitol-5-phosphate cytidylyltransferase [Clostridia bacterium]